MTAIQLLRADLNRNRSYVIATRKGIKKGIPMKQSTLVHMGIRNHDAAVIRKALKDLRKVKPVYTWMKRETQS